MRLLIRTRNAAVAVDGEHIAEPHGGFDLVLDLPAAEVRAGLINAHDHLHRNHYGRLGQPPYRSASHWARDIQARRRTHIERRRRRPRCEALLAGAWKNLFAGVTSVVHHDAWEAEVEQGFPLTVLRVRNADSLRMTPDLNGWDGEGAFSLHLAEGTDGEAAEEVRTLAARGLLTRDLIAVHGVGMDADGIARFRASGAALVWCPSSNLFLFGRTAPGELLADGVDVLLGSDSRLTGAGDLLDELRCARRQGAVDDDRLEGAVGAVAARRLGLDEPSLLPGATADLIVLSRPLLEADRSDVLLVIAGGVPRVAHPDLAARLEAVWPGGRAMRRGSLVRWANGRPAVEPRAKVPVMIVSACSEPPLASIRRRLGAAAGVTALALSGACIFAAPPASAQQSPAPEAGPQPVQDTATPASPASTQASSSDTAARTAAAGEAPVAVPAPPADSGSQVDIFSGNTLSVLLDARLVVADGAASFVNGGFGKTRFQGDSRGDFRAQAVPVEADVVWQPRFSEALTANVSGAYQRDHENGFDLIEAFVNYLPRQTGRFGFSGRAGLMWPEISLEHSTGGAWSVVNTITPSAINSWVGEETKVIGVEGTLHASFGQHDLLATGGVFGFNDTSGTLLSFRGWALHDIKATAFGHFPLPPLNDFITLLQQHETRSTVEIDKRVGFYGRLDWRPPWPFGVALFYYDNEGDPEAFYSSGQWGWRTRFWNLSFNADLGPGTRLLAQGMTGSTIMGFQENGENWVHTDFNAAYALVTHSFGRVSVTGRVDVFDTREHGSEMPADNSENGWAMTAAARVNLTSRLTMFAEAMNVRSTRGTRVDFGLVSPFEAQTVFQLAFRFRL